MLRDGTSSFVPLGEGAGTGSSGNAAGVVLGAVPGGPALSGILGCWRCRDAVGLSTKGCNRTRRGHLGDLCPCLERSSVFSLKKQVRGCLSGSVV